MYYWTWLSAAGMAVLVFLITLTPSHNAFGVLYTLVIVLVAERCSIPTLRAVAAGCLLLECSAFLIVHHGLTFRPGASRLALSVIATILVTLIAERNRRTRDALERQSRILARADRIKTLGQLGIAIAHEVNQPLAAIATFSRSGARWLRRAPPDIDEALYCFEQIDTNTGRAAEIIRNVQEMTRGEQIERQALLDLRKLVQEAVDFVKNGIVLDAIEIQKINSGKNPFIRGNKTEIQQLIINLIMNAIEAIHQTQSRAGVITLSTRIVSDTDHVVEIKISDTGAGFQSLHTQDYFEPFRTTKPSGMGMGLCICQSIVDAHGGSIKAENTPPAGALITVRLPLAREGV